MFGVLLLAMATFLNPIIFHGIVFGKTSLVQGFNHTHYPQHHNRSNVKPSSEDKILINTAQPNQTSNNLSHNLKPADTVNCKDNLFNFSKPTTQLVSLQFDYKIQDNKSRQNGLVFYHFKDYLNNNPTLFMVRSKRNADTQGVSKRLNSISNLPSTSGKSQTQAHFSNHTSLQNFFYIIFICTSSCFA